MTATSFARKRLDSSSSARRVSTEPRPPISPSIWRAIHSASSSSLKASKRWIGTPPWFAGPELLVGPALVARDHRVGRVEDQLRRAVVLLQLDHRGVRVVPLEVEDVLDVGAAPAVDRLVVVAHHAQVAMGGRQGPHPQVLRPVRVLVLVHVEVAPAGLVLRQHLGRLLEQVHGPQQQVVEVERVRGAEALPVAGGQAGDDALPVVDRVLRPGTSSSSISFLARLMAPRIAAGRNSPVAGRSSSARIRFISCCWSSVS